MLVGLGATHTFCHADGMELDLNAIPPALLEALKDKSAIQALEREIAKRTQVAGEPHQFYTFAPRPKLKYQQFIFRCQARLIALIGANQIGKTLCGKRWVSARLLGFDPLYPEIRWKVPAKVWACTSGALISGLFDEILEMIPPGEIERISRSKGDLSVKLKNGSLLEMKSFDQKKDALMQAKCDVVWWDEEGPEDHWMELQFRLLARGGTMLLTLTPVKGTTWLNTELHGLNKKYQNAIDGDFAWFTASVLDNDTVDQDRLRLILEKCKNDPQAYQIRVLGNYLELSGSNVFEQEFLDYQRKRHNRPPIKTGNFDLRGEFYEDLIRDSEWVIYEDSIPGLGYSMGVDVAEGQGSDGRNDYSSIHVLKAANNQVVATWHGEIDPDYLGHEAYFAGKMYNEATVCVEMNKQGGVVSKTLRDLNYPRLYIRSTYSGRIENVTKSYGWHTDPHSKPALIHQTKMVVHQKRCQIPCQRTLEQMAVYQRLKAYRRGEHSYGTASRSQHDDCVISFSLAVEATTQTNSGIVSGADSYYETVDENPARILMQQMYQQYKGNQSIEEAYELMMSDEL